MIDVPMERRELDRKTVRRYARAASPEQLLGPNPSSGPGLLAAFKPYLQARCAEGVTATSVLYAEIRARGYRGGERTLRRFLVQVRGGEQQPPTAPPVASARQLTTWIMRPDDKLSDDDRTGLKTPAPAAPTWPPSPTKPTGSTHWSANVAVTSSRHGSTRWRGSRSPRFAASPPACAATSTPSQQTTFDTHPPVKITSEVRRWPRKHGACPMTGVVLGGHR